MEKSDEHEISDKQCLSPQSTVKCGVQLQSVPGLERFSDLYHNHNVVFFTRINKAMCTGVRKADARLGNRPPK